MGLDMYAYISKEKPVTAVPDALPKDATQIHYWRKHPDLHGWMENLYQEKGGTAAFNCTPLVLTGEDLDRLEAAIREKTLPLTDGFFFGSSDGREVEDDLEFIRQARKALQRGLTVLYDSWW